MIFVLLAVANAFAIMAIVIAIFSVVAFDLFGTTDTYNFGSFSRSYFSMFQVHCRCPSLPHFLTFSLYPLSPEISLHH